MFKSKQKNGYWYIIYFDKNGKRRKKTTKTKNCNVADMILTKFKKDYFTECKDLSLGEVISKFLEFKKNYYTDRTYKDHACIYKEFLNFNNNKKIKKITQEDINNYTVFLFKKANSPVTINMKLSLIKILFDFSLDNKYTNEIFKFTKTKTIIKKEKEFLTFNDFEKLLKCCTCKDLSDVITVTYLTGMRLQEAINLEWDNINFSDKYILLDNQKFITKTKINRTLPLTNIAYSILSRRYDTKENNLVFTYKGKKWWITTLQKHFKILTNNVFTNRNISFHNLRHSYATNLVLSSVPIAKVAKLLGHASINSTMTYTHIDYNDLKDATKCLEKLEVEQVEHTGVTKIVLLNNTNMATENKEEDVKETAKIIPLNNTTNEKVG